MFGKKKAQAALEYLTTYGWALLIIVIVIAALWTLAPTSPPQLCRFDQPSFGCPLIPQVTTAGVLYMRMTNSNSNDINVTGVLCTENKTTTPPANAAFTLITNGRKVPSQDILEIPGTGTSAITVICRRSDGSANFARGEDFSGRVWIRYRNTEDPTTFPNRTVSAAVSTKVT